jgi:2-methylcitrate dehydratase PrpD
MTTTIKPRDPARDRAPRTAHAAQDLAAWVHEFVPSTADLALADRSLADTLAVTLGGRDTPLRAVAGQLPDAARWGAVGHVLDYDDLHIESTTHISVVCVPAVLAVGGDASAYLAGAGVMARLGNAMGWGHYSRGWHATCTAGAPAAAAAAAYALGLDRDQTAAAMSLAVSAAGGVQGAFGSMAKSLQVGLASAAGVQAARLVQRGASANAGAFDEWLGLVAPDADPIDVDSSDPAVPGGLAIKIYPCCYALQRPISAVLEMSQASLASPAFAGGVVVGDVARIVVTTPEACVQPLIWHRPTTGLQAKFSLEYAVAVALLDGRPGPASFDDDAVRREAITRLVDQVELVTTPGGQHLLSGDITVRVEFVVGETKEVRLQIPPGAPGRPPSKDDMLAKMRDCGEDVPGLLDGIDWSSARALLLDMLPAA